MAEMKAAIIPGHKGSARIRFVNAGKADAKNIKIEILSTKEEMSGILYTKFGPYDVINPQSHREEHLSLCEGHSKTIKLRITWDDEFQKERSVSLSVPI